MLAESWLDLRVGIQQMNPNHFASDFGHFDSTIHIVVDCYCYATECPSVPLIGQHRRRVAAAEHREEAEINR